MPDFKEEIHFLENETDLGCDISQTEVSSNSEVLKKHDSDEDGEGGDEEGSGGHGKQNSLFRDIKGIGNAKKRFLAKPKVEKTLLQDSVRLILQHSHSQRVIPDRASLDQLPYEYRKFLGIMGVVRLSGQEVHHTSPQNPPMKNIAPSTYGIMNQAGAKKSNLLSRWASKGQDTKNSSEKSSIFQKSTESVSDLPSEEEIIFNQKKRGY